MIYIPILIIIIILAIDLYYTHEERFNEIMLFTNKETEKEGEPSEPWSKIIMGKKYNKYYLKIENIKRYIDNFILWTEQPFISEDMIDIDVNENYLIIKVPDEETALVIGNLMISNFMGDMTLEEIREKNMVAQSIVKAKKHKIISVKLKELIKENLYIMNESEKSEPESEEIESLDTNNITYDIIEPVNSVVNKVEPAVKVDIPFDRYMPMFRVTPYEGGEYASVNF